MKLYYAPASPYARKVRACAITREIDRQLTLVEVNPHQSPAELLAGNPLSKVPCLLTADGVALFDSPVICEYLDSVADGVTSLFPPHGGPRWRALNVRHRAAVRLRLEGSRATARAWHVAVGRRTREHHAATARTKSRSLRTFAHDAGPGRTAGPDREIRTDDRRAVPHRAQAETVAAGRRHLEARTVVADLQPDGSGEEGPMRQPKDLLELATHIF